MRTRQMRFTRWMLIPVVMGIVLLSGCGLRGLFGGSSTSPAEATVTAIVKTATANTPCNSGKVGTSSPAIAATLVSTAGGTSVTLGVFGKTTVTLVGTCWLGGQTIRLAVLGKGTDGSRVLIPLTDANASAPPPTGTAGSGATVATPAPGNPPLKGATKPDGTFTITFPLSSDLAPYVTDTRLALIAYSDNFVQIAGTTIQVS